MDTPASPSHSTEGGSGRMPQPHRATQPRGVTDASASSSHSSEGGPGRSPPRETMDASASPCPSRTPREATEVSASLCPSRTQRRERTPQPHRARVAHRGRQQRTQPHRFHTAREEAADASPYPSPEGKVPSSSSPLHRQGLRHGKGDNGVSLRNSTRLLLQTPSAVPSLGQ